MDVPDDDRDEPDENADSSMCVRPASPTVLSQFSHLYPRFVQRFLVPRYAKSSTGEDIRILTHSNRICIVTLSPLHPVVRDRKQISTVNYQVTEKTNRSETQPKGKKKKGAQLLNPEAILCRIVCVDGNVYAVRSEISGKLCEVNERLIQEPQLIVERPASDGYIAIVFPSIKTYENRIKKQLMSESEYFASSASDLDHTNAEQLSREIHTDAATVTL